MSKTQKLSEMFRGHFYMPTPRLVLLGAMIGVVLLILGGAVSQKIVDVRRSLVMQEMQKRLEIMSESRADVISTWLDGLALVGDHIVRSDVVRLYASEVVLKDALDVSMQAELNQSLLAQEAYMEHMMKEYVHQNNLVKAFMATDKGRIFLSSTTQKKLTEKEMEAIAQVLEHRAMIVTPVQVSSNELLLDIYKPVYALEEGPNTRIVSVMASTFKATGSFMEFVEKSPLHMPGERVYIMQMDNDGQTLKNVSVQDDVSLQNIPNSALDGTFRNDEGFSIRKSAVGEAQVFASSATTRWAPFVVVHEFEAKAALAPLAEYSQAVYSNVLLVVTGLMVALTAWMIYAVGARNRRRVLSQQKAMDALVRATEIRDPYLAGHHKRVAKLALQIGNVLGLSVDSRSTLYYGAMLSGVGKIFVPQDILTKKGKLTAAEKKKMQAHITYAQNVLQDVDFEIPVEKSITQMYERLDGSGYPNKLKGEEISDEARVLAVCDVFCALTQPRSYRKEMNAEAALKQLAKDAKKFDQDVIEALESLVQ